MKKVLFSLLLLAIATTSFSQYYPDMEAYCKYITVEKDAMTGEAVYKTPFDRSISFRKLVTNGVEVTYMRVSAVSKFDKKGGNVSIRFQKGYTIEREVATNFYKNLDGTFTHYAEFKLSKDDISKIKNYLIVDCKVYMYNQAIENNMQFKSYMHCLTKMH